MAWAGWRSRDHIVLYLFAKTVMPFCVGGAAAVLLFVVPIADLEFEIRAFIVLGLTVAGTYLPDVIIRNAQTKRKLALTQ